MNIFIFLQCNSLLNIYLPEELLMFIQTTINIKCNNLEKLLKATLITGKSKTYILSCLMNRLSKDITILERYWSRIQYQQRSNKKVWRCVHVSIRQDEYEFFIDLRKIYKSSVSFLIAYGIEKYLDEIVRKILNSVDNYSYRNYILSRVVISGVVCWILYWGLPDILLSSLWRINKNVNLRHGSQSWLLYNN